LTETKNPPSPVEDSDIELWLKSLESIYRESGRFNEFKDELPFLQLYLQKLKAEIDEQLYRMYKIEQPIAMGGTGIIFKAMHKNLPGRELVLKFNRPLPMEKLSRVNGELMSQVENERRILRLFDHSNIIPILDSGIFEIEISGDSRPLSFIVEPFVPEAKTLGKYVESLSYRKLDTVSVSMLDRSLQCLVASIHQWVSALLHVHKKGFVYLDLKPSNALVDRDGHVTAIDFGSAQKRDGGNAPVEVFVTKYYAHPRLRDRFLKSTSENRVKCSIMRNEIVPNLDFYALGKSILDLLSILIQEEAHPHDFPQRPLSRSLHFLATRLLDGQNGKQSGVEKSGNHAEKPRIGGLDKEILTEFFGGLDESDYGEICYTCLEDVLVDLEKENGSWNPEHEIPELSTFSKSVVRVVPNINTVLTHRLREILEHPLVARLKAISQLGLITLLYPTADHSRYDHVLGAYTYSAAYIKSLFHDSQNPMFRNIVDEKYIKGALLAALLHDLGQFPLAHDLEEVCPKIFGHGNISIELLHDETKNEDGKSIAGLIQGKDGWNVDLKCVERILGAHSRVTSGQTKFEQHEKDFKAEMISAVIDGPIDADKADYIVRDSTQCRIPYGEQLDIERLQRVLTTVRIPSYITSKYRVTIGVYEKGRASADSFGLSRYLLYSSVYWHHTSRILKAMLQYATTMLLPQEVFSTGSDTRISEIRGKLVDFLLNLVPPFEESKDHAKSTSREKVRKQPVAKPPEFDVIDQVIEREAIRAASKRAKSWYPGICNSDWLMLEWLKGLSHSPKAVKLIELIQRRKLYKRSFAFQRDDTNRDLITQLDHLDWPEKVALCEIVQKDTKYLLELRMREEPSRLSRSLADPETIDRVFNENFGILIDIPDPKTMTARERPLIYIPELERKTYYHESMSPVKAQSLTAALELLMESISPVRLLCHPQLRQPIQLYLKQSDIRSIVEGGLSAVVG
jgi:HD superfamily phosphohydrolase